MIIAQDLEAFTFFATTVVHIQLACNKYSKIYIFCKYLLPSYIYLVFVCLIAHFTCVSDQFHCFIFSQFLQIIKLIFSSTVLAMLLNFVLPENLKIKFSLII